MGNARKKPNSASVVGALIVAGFLGAVTGSWFVFWLAAGILVLTALYTSEIRPLPTDW